ncbi:transducin/WD40 repeat-like superfamily protein [Actinidia rufa]|uniref:Transducin/WD40 repeat-like superfamily protein n=1 Tax=Actinidia rufa TaxID=165716 RepID=A0A7J0G6F3_9ERIC|nr:transducin/WD40 repeat-like superfamily protein [Actinidia rufa]
MASPFQAAALVASPSYPNAFAWSDENLVAVASGHLVTILNPATPFGPGGLITISPSKSFPIGVIERKDLLSGCLLPTCLSRNLRPCVRSISWSPIGFAPNSGCLLAVCTTEGQAKVYRMLYCEFSAEWVEEQIHQPGLENECSGSSVGWGSTYLDSRHAGSLEWCRSSCCVLGDRWKPPSMDTGNLPQEISLCNSCKVEEILKTGDVVEAWTNDRWVEGIFMGLIESGLLVKLHGDIGSVTLDVSCVRLAPLWINEQNSWQVTLVKIEMKGPELCKVVEIKSDNRKANNVNQIVPVPNSKAKSTKKVPEKSPLPLITADQYSSRCAMLSLLVVAWDSTAAFLVGFLQAHSAWITSIGWALFASDASDPQLLLATGSSDGSVKIWLGDNGALLKCSEVNHTPFSLLKEVIIVDLVPVAIVSLIVPVQSPNKMHLAVGKGSGSIDVCDISTATSKYDEVSSYGAHDHIVTGLAWAFDGCCLYSCGQHVAPKYIEHAIAKRLISCGGTQLGLNIEENLSQVSRLLSKISSRRLHLLNIISRRVVLAELQADNINCSKKILGVYGAEQHLALWLELILSSESELRGRLVAISLSAVSSLISHSSISGNCYLVGYALMEQWVALNHDYVQDNLKILVAEVSKLKKGTPYHLCLYLVIV